jgi:hypothetical protein
MRPGTGIESPIPVWPSGDARRSRLVSQRDPGRVAWLWTAIGLPFVASEPRVKAAVLGLAGLGNRPGAERFEKAVRGLTVPVLLVLQWNDELVGQDSGLALFDAIGSPEKTLHVNPGGHVQIPLFERDAFEAFFLRHLGPAGSPT